MKSVNIKIRLSCEEPEEFFYLKAVSNDWGIIEYSLVDQFDVRIKSYYMIILPLPQLLKKYKDISQLISDIEICFVKGTNKKVIYALKR